MVSRVDAQALGPRAGALVRTAWPPAVERSLWRAPYTVLGPELSAPRSEIAAARGSCVRGALIGGGVGTVVGVGWLVVAGEGDLFESSRDLGFAALAIGAGALIGCALASG
jgi:hypothetical protein